VPTLILCEVEGVQCAAHNKVLASKIVAPQNWKLPDKRATCHGMGEGAASPPTILLASNMNCGISAHSVGPTVGPTVVFGAKVVGPAVVGPPWLLGSRHSQAVQYVSHPPKSLLQQAPPSQLQPALLFSSSHH